MHSKSDARARIGAMSPVALTPRKPMLARVTRCAHASPILSRTHGGDVT